MKFFNHYKTIVISDIPLGASPDYFKKLIYFIKNTSCDKLIFCGDIIKGWQSKKIEKLYKLHNKFLKVLFKISERDNTKIIFVTGPEWNYKENVGNFNFSNISFVNSYSFNSAGTEIYVIPGDISNQAQKTPLQFFPPKLIQYNLLLWLNKKYNLYRINQGKEYNSLLKKFIPNIHNETYIYNVIEEYKTFLTDICIQKECEGIIYGHSAYTGIYQLGGLMYLSSGYWSESLTALAESNYGKWNILNFQKVMQDKLEALHYSEILEELFNEETD